MQARILLPTSGDSAQRNVSHHAFHISRSPGGTLLSHLSSRLLVQSRQDSVILGCLLCSATHFTPGVLLCDKYQAGKERETWLYIFYKFKSSVAL